MARLSTLRSAHHFERVFREGKFTVKDNLVMHSVASDDEGVRFGFVLSAKVGKAHRRNLLRRRMREVARALLSRIRAGYHIVFVVSHDKEESFADLRAKMTYLLDSRGLLVEEKQ